MTLALEDGSAFSGLSEQMVEQVSVEQRAWLQGHRPISHYLAELHEEERLAVERDGSRAWTPESQMRRSSGS